MRILLPLIGLLAAAIPPCPAATPSPREIEFFENKIRPVLAENCYECHNSIDKEQGGKKKGGIALDYAAALLASDIIVPGHPEKSPLIKAIRHEADVEPMPSKKPRLAKLIIKSFEDWVRMGAPDPREKKPTKEELANEVDWDAVRAERAKWWSYQPVRNPRPPSVADPEWNRSAIDRFLHARLQAEGIPPRKLAAPELRIRRLHQVLLGIPPSPETVAAFVADPSPAAWEKQVDALLDSPRFGERWGRYWLDWWRYAESHGSEGDPAVPYATVYRDYVIRALNADVPYDQLIREHVAGDLLEQPRINQELGLNESAIGPAHFRMVPQGFGVTDAYAEQIAFTDNQVDVLSKAVLGTTLACARCHNHKFDPVSQADFYKFYGIMISSRPGVVNVDSPALQRKHRAALRGLKQEIRTGFADYWQEQLASVIRKLDTGDQAVKGLKKSAGKDTHPLHAWFTLSQRPEEAMDREWQALRKRHQDREAQNRERIALATFYADLRDQATYDQWFRNGTGLGPKVAPAGSFAVAPEGGKALAGIYPRGIYTHLLTDKDNATLGSIFHLAKGKYHGVRAIGSNATARYSARSYPLMHGGLHPAPGLKPEWNWIDLRKYVYWSGERIFYQFQTASDQTFKTGKGRGWFGVTEVYAGEQNLQELGHPAPALPGAPARLAKREQVIAFYASAIENAIAGWKQGRMVDAQAALLESLRRQGLLMDELAALPAPLRSAVEKYRALEREIRMPVRAPGVLEGEAWNQPLLVQGQYTNEDAPVPRGFLEVFGGRTYAPENSGRRELAEDLLAAGNTLTTRVIVNRLWHHVFGQGIVSSTDNLGRLGKPPSHPELLDHLATRFRAEGWSIKRMIRALVTSRAFQSESIAPPGAAEKDPGNRLLSHYTPRRLDAEAIFDTLQFIAGSNQQAAIYRRAKRNQLDPFLTAFNYPIPTTTVGVRDLTNVPAQSLIMMNGPEARNSAEQWARRIQADRALSSDAQRIERLFAMAYSRPPRPEEMSACLTYLSGKEDDGTLARLATEHGDAAARLELIKAARAKTLKPVRDKLQARADARNKAAAKQGPKPVDLKPIARWDFEGDTRDLIGGMHGKILGQARVEDGALVLEGGCVLTAPINRDLKAKSLEVLLQLDTPDQRAGGAMVIQTLDGATFDGIVHAEIAPREWLTGSNNHRRTQSFEGPRDDDAHLRPVRLVLVYAEDGTVRAFRDGKPYGKAIKKSARQDYRAGRAQVAFGTRHGTRPGRELTGRILEARLYDRALRPEEVAAAARGLTLEIVTAEDLLEALPPETRKKIRTLDEQIAAQEGTVSRLARQLANERAAHGQTPNGLARLAHALLNSKELIYVY